MSIVRDVRRLAGFFFIPLLAAPSAVQAQPEALLARASSPLRYQIMTFNLKFASEGAAHAWHARRRLVRDAILSQNPDLLGTQEGLYGQLSNIAADLPDYGWVGQGREGGSRGEFSAIFYKRSKFRVLDHGDFWLSSTPTVPGSRSWGNFVPRMASWVLFEDKASGARFYHFNTHFDHIMPYARLRSAELLNERIAARAHRYPVVLTGDFNTGQRGRVHRLLTRQPWNAAGLCDSWDRAPVHEGLGVSTFHNWRGPQNGGRRIDWILASPDFQCTRARVVLFSEAGQWPSDHFPVSSSFSFNHEPRVAMKTARPALAAAYQ